MFSITAKTKVIKDMVSMTSALVQEIKLVTSAEGISIKAVDNSHVSMVSLNMDKTAFISYRADDSEIGIPLDKFKDAIKTAGPEISVEYEESKGRLVIKSGNITRRMNVIDMSNVNETRIPKLDLTTSVKVPLSEISKSIVASAGVSDAISFVAENDTLIIRSGNATDDMMEMSISKPTIKECTMPEKATTTVPLDFYSVTMKALSVKDVTLHMATDYPLRIAFSENGISGEYLIAPRIEADE